MNTLSALGRVLRRSRPMTDRDKDRLVADYARRRGFDRPRALDRELLASFNANVGSRPEVTPELLARRDEARRVSGAQAWSRKAGKGAILSAASNAALASGEHVHHVERDGVRCINGTCPADERGYLYPPEMSKAAPPPKG